MRPPKAETKKILLRAAEILEGGWCVGHYAIAGRSVAGTGQQYFVRLSEATAGVDKFCLSGSILKAVQEYEGLGRVDSGVLWQHPLAAAALDVLRDGVSPMVWSPAHWNDFVCRSGAEAAAKIREAADGLGN